MTVEKSCHKYGEKEPSCKKVKLHTGNKGQTTRTRRRRFELETPKSNLF